MTGTGRRHRWSVSAGALLVVAAVLAGWSARRGDDGADGTDTTPVAHLVSVERLARLVGRTDLPDATAPAALGSDLGAAGALLATPQEVGAFRAHYGTGPRDLASQIGTYLAALANDVSPPDACGDRATRLGVADTTYVVELVAAAAVALRPDVAPEAAIATTLPRPLDDAVRAQVSAVLAAGDVSGAVDLVVSELGDRAARLVVAGLVAELSGVLSASEEADYLGDFLAAVRFVGNVDAIADSCH